MVISPCRRLPPLGIAHHVVGKTFQVLEVHQEEALHKALVEKKVKDGLLCILLKSGQKTRFCYILDCYPIYVDIV